MVRRAKNIVECDHVTCGLICKMLDLYTDTPEGFILNPGNTGPHYIAIGHNDEDIHDVDIKKSASPKEFESIMDNDPRVKGYVWWLTLDNHDAGLVLAYTRDTRHGNSVKGIWLLTEDGPQEVEVVAGPSEDISSIGDEVMKVIGELARKPPMLH